ncbi:hypothetical protein L210DRAFT_3614745 [Boletus edulis BED1]|uniref:Uncharacterized protein n=1 Tax=Boletus edulis BED1 TaxID=1328754 RepID=A0AAD4BGJ2_BOLED|nr:hypothetical protein L210DRAFT_3614745 [Boletus edulis BED1]
MTSDTIRSDDILTGPETFPLWKVKVTRKLRSGQVYGVVSGTDAKPTLGTTGVTASDIRDWLARDEKAHGIIQERISHAIGIGTVPLISQVSGKTYEVILSNVLLIPEFHLSLISVNRLASANLSVSFPGNSDACYIRKDRNTILIAKHKGGLYHAKVTPSEQKETAHAAVDHGQIWTTSGNRYRDRNTHIL